MACIEDVLTGKGFGKCDARAGTDACITCVMKGMEFGTDVNAFDNLAAHILSDKDSEACLAAAGPLALDDNPYNDLSDLLDDLKADEDGNDLDLATVLGNN